jgi:hypothetical protein
MSENSQNPYPSKTTLMLLSENANLTVEQIANWIKHARIKKTITNNNRTSLTFEQKIILKQSFKLNNKLESDEKKRLAEKINISEKRVIQWFASERYKHTKTYDVQLQGLDAIAQ